MNQQNIIIVGAGPAGLMAAQHLATKGFNVHVYDQNKAAARKFLVAGKGGFNLTHSENIDAFVEKYDAPEIKNIVRYFDNKRVVEWLHDLGITTFSGSSGKIFPTKNYKPIQVLKAWLDRLVVLGVTFHYDFRLLDFDESTVHFDNNQDKVSVSYSNLILALGGGSWKKTGSDARWVSFFHAKDIKITELQAANSGYETEIGYHHLEGQYLKNIKVTFKDHSKNGEVVFTKYGIEGSPVYFLNRFTRKYDFPQTLLLDLKPQLTDAELSSAFSGNERIGSVLKKKLKLSTTALNLLKTLDKDTYTDSSKLVGFIRNFPLKINNFRPLEEVISTAGGVSFSELTPKLELKKYPHVFCVGEMIDWEAPTGGYLLQACFSTGFWAAVAIIKKS